MTPSHRVILNTIATYGRSILAVGLMLFSSRWVLNALGQTDFGLFSVVGSVIIFITVINSVMAGSVARHYAYAIGRGDMESINQWFNTALFIHLVLASTLVLVGWPVGEYLIVHILSVPDDRTSACLWVFRVSLGSAFFSMVSMPFVAMFTARQRMIEQACWLMGHSLLMFFLAMNLERVSGDRLIFYAVGMVIIIVFIQTGQIARAMFVFKDCRIKMSYWYDGPRIKEVFSFAGWILVGAVGVTMRDQGSAILLNLHFGPKVNAAYGIAYQVSTAANMLTNAMISALSPEITSSEGRGDRKRMLDLAQRASKLGTIFIMVFAVPLIAEMDYVLTIWLLEPPAYAAILCQLILIAVLIDRLNSGASLAIIAHGRIAAYHATLGIFIVLTLPLAWIFLELGAPPTSVGIASIVTISAVSGGRVFWMRRLLKVSVRQWIKNVFLPIVTVALIAIVAVLLPKLFMQSSFARFIIICASGILTIKIAAWFIVLDCMEREFIERNGRRLLCKISDFVFPYWFSK